MGRWIIVSNRLPFSFDKAKNKLAPSSGGLVTAIRGIKSKNSILWIGSLPDKESAQSLKKHKDVDNISFSFPELDPELYDSYYNGFCNDVLWPILHYESDSVKFRESNWEDYKKVNRIFAQHILKCARPDDMIWIHDYQLFLLPQMLKEKNPKLKIGFFLHVPFPSSEIWRQLPCREEILTSLIHADLVGFHDFSYLRHFASSVYILLGIHSSLLEIRSQYNDTKLGVYPVSIDTKDFAKKAASLRTQKEMDRFNLKKGRCRYILGVDRLDYSKGIINKLQAYRHFLSLHPEMATKTQLIQIAVPSRTDVEEYIKLRHDIERLVSEINGEYSTIDHIPVKYIFNSVSTYELMALYRSCDVLLVTSKRDGMNLVSLEYIATQDPKDPGVVMLSEFAGAASTLSHAMIINPMNIQQCAESIGHALSMDKQQRLERHHIMFDYLSEYTASAWAQSFINHLKKKTLETPSKAISLENKSKKAALLNKFKNKSRIIMLDYDGTLTPIVNNPKDALLPEKIRQIISKLSLAPQTQVVIVSGRDSTFIKSQLKGIDCYLACEHGARFYDYKAKRWRNLASSNNSNWFGEATQMIKEYTRRTPNSFFEKKNHAIAWHYRNSPQDFGEFQARKLVVDLEAALSHLPVSVILGKKVVEVKSIEANKGYFTQWFVERYVKEEDCIIALGDDRTDEDMFEALEKSGVTVKVGSPAQTKAQYYLKDQKQVQSFLNQFL